MRLLHLLTESEEDQVYTGPKTVTWAAENEERIIENREELSELRSRKARDRLKHGKMLPIFQTDTLFFFNTFRKDPFEKANRGE